MKNKQSINDGERMSIGTSSALQTVFLSQEKIEIIRISASKLENIIHKFFQKLSEKKPAGTCFSTGVSILLTWLPSEKFNDVIGLSGEFIKSSLLIISLILIVLSISFCFLSPNKKETSADSLFSSIKGACTIEEPCIAHSVSIPYSNQQLDNTNDSNSSTSSAHLNKKQKTRSMRKQPLSQEIEDYLS